MRHCRAAGLRRVALVMNDEVKRDFAELEEEDTACDAVIVGDLGDAFGYDVLNHAFRQVIDGAELIALQKNRYWLRADGLSLDVGPFVAALEYATGREAYVVGKPARAFFDEIVAGLPPGVGGVAMVGDDIDADIGGALRAGLARDPREHGQVPPGSGAGVRDHADADRRLDRGRPPADPRDADSFAVGVMPTPARRGRLRIRSAQHSAAAGHASCAGAMQAGDHRPGAAGPDAHPAKPGSAVR